MITDYNKENIIELFQRIEKETKDNREKALKLYDHMETFMTSVQSSGKGDLIVLSQMASDYLAEATKQTDLLVRLSSVMQKLNQIELKDNNKDKGSTKNKDDINKLLEGLDLQKMSPFVVRNKN